MSNRINYNLKFSNIDILSFMNRVVLKHTKYYRKDFQIDKKILRKAAKKKQGDKTFIWLCRESGTWLLSEKYTLIKNTREFNTFSFYAKYTNDTVLAFLIEVTGIKHGSVIGNIYVLNYPAYYNRICSLSVKPDTVILTYEHGCCTQDANKRIDGNPHVKYGELQSIKYLPQSQEELSKILLNEQHERKQFQEGNPNEYLASL